MVIHPALDFANTGKNFARESPPILIVRCDFFSILMALSACLQGIVSTCVQIITEPW